MPSSQQGRRQPSLVQTRGRLLEEERQLKEDLQAPSLVQCILPVVLEHVKVQLVLFKRDILQELRREAALCASMKVQDCSEEIRRLQDNMQ